MSQYKSANELRKFLLQIRESGAAAGKVILYVYSDGTEQLENQQTSAVVFPDGATSWTHIAFVYDGSGTPYVDIYVNGALVASTTGVGGIPASLWTSPELFTLASLSTPASYFAGNIQSVAVFNQALSASDINYIYQKDKGRYGG